MAHEDNLTVLENANTCNEELISVQKKLADAHSEIEELKLQLEWLERSYE